MEFKERRNSERVASSVVERETVATLSELRLNKCVAVYPQGFKANPGLELANAFSVINPLLRSGEKATVTELIIKGFKAKPWAGIANAFSVF